MFRALSLALRSLGSACALLTVLPIPRRWQLRPEEPPGYAMTGFPLVGIALGAILAGAGWSLRFLFPPSLTAALLLGLWAGMTGLLHLDGFCDCCDGLLVTTSPQRRLEILKDPRVGAYGVIGVTLLLLTKYAALRAWLEGGGSLLPLMGLAACSRWAMACIAWAFPYARREGMGGHFRRGFRWPHLLGASLGLLLGLFSSTPWLLAFTFLLGTILGAGGLAFWASRRLGGGLTGDVYGAVNEWVEVLCLIAAVAVGTPSG